MGQTRPKDRVDLTKFTPYNLIQAYSKCRFKNYVDLISLRIHRKPTNKFYVQLHVKTIMDWRNKLKKNYERLKKHNVAISYKNKQKLWTLI